MTREIYGIYGIYGGDAESICGGGSVCPAQGKWHDSWSDHRILPVRGAADPTVIGRHECSSSVNREMGHIT
jgi:hypothetical protein